jgi:aryl-alcohol dehydrogenase-like predicted oxidoreductase
MTVKPPYKTLGQVAIRFALGPHAVSTVIVGARSADQVRENVHAALLPSLPATLVARLADEYGGLDDDFNTGKQ